MAQIMHVLCGPGVVTFCLPKLLRWKTKRRHLPWQSRVLGDGVSLCISRLDKTPERWRLCLLTDGFLVWHLTGGRSGSISQSIVHLICCSVALMKIQGNILMGFFKLFDWGVFLWFGVLSGVFWGCHLEFRVSRAIKSHNCLNISLGYCLWAKQILGLKHILSWKFWEKKNPSLRMLFLFGFAFSEFHLVSNKSLLCFWIASVHPF